MIDPKVIRQLVKLMTENDLTELNLEDEGQKIQLRRDSPHSAVQIAPMAQAPAQPQVPTTPPAPAVEPSTTEEAAAQMEGQFIRSPMVGSFYAASSPDAEPFVKVGDKVNVDDVVCIIEAMKVFNEIKAETSGTIAEILVENGESVEFDQPIFRIK